MVWHALQPILPGTHQHQGVSHWDRMPASVGYGNQVGARTASAILNSRSSPWVSWRIQVPQLPALSRWQWFRRFGLSFVRPAAPGCESGTYFGCRMQPQESVLCSTRWRFSQCCPTTARPGFSARRRWHSWRAFIFKWHVWWQRDTCLTEALIDSGPTPCQRMFRRSVGCTLSISTL